MDAHPTNLGVWRSRPRDLECRYRYTRPPARPFTESEARGEAPRETKAPSVLLATDNTAELTALHRALTRRGFRCQSALSVRLALRTLRAIRVDVVIADGGAFAAGAIDLLEATKASFPAVRRILLGGRTTPALAPEGGLVDAFVAKPVEVEELVASLRADAVDDDSIAS